jgi:hypothetical protein
VIQIERPKLVIVGWARTVMTVQVRSAIGLAPVRKRQKGKQNGRCERSPPVTAA